jgi:hypothetical protein
LATQDGDIFESRGPQALQYCYILHLLYPFHGHAGSTLALTARFSARFVTGALSLPRLEESKALRELAAASTNGYMLMRRAVCGNTPKQRKKSEAFAPNTLIRSAHNISS